MVVFRRQGVVAAALASVVVLIAHTINVSSLALDNIS